MTRAMEPLADLVGESSGIVAVRETIARLLKRHSDARRLPPILMQGETGTGKGLVARAIHRAGPRAAGPFVDVNCAAIPATLLEAEMFGFERGAFTDARQAKRGLFQAAHRGTIFLDEVGLLPEELQSKLLKVIEEQAVRRLGSTRSEPVDVWVLTATSEDLLAATRTRRFREDLYHRLAVLTIWLPPVRERGRDVTLLAERFLAAACADYDLPPKTLTPEARAALLGYRWPGNVRELANVMERVALLSESSAVTAEALGLPETLAERPAAAAREGGAVPLDDAVQEVERAHLVEALERTGWNISRAAARLGVPRNTLRYRMEKYGLRPGAVPDAPHRRAGRAPARGSPVEAPGPAPSAPAPGVRWERRRVALLRAALQPEPGAAEAPGDGGRGFETLVDKVQSFGGRADDLSPTGILAAFGLDPVEDAASRAALAAIAIQKAAERARRVPGEGFAVRIAIHVGHFLVGQAGGVVTIESDAKRDAAGVLEAMLETAEPGTTLVSEVAAPLLQRRFELAPAAGPAGGAGRVYRLAGRERPGLGVGGRMARFVGRRQDLELLQSRLAAAVAGQGQVVGIVGESGIGKSRLLFEFRQALPGAHARYLEGHCVSYGSAIPYLPLLDLVREHCRMSDADSPELMRQKVRGGLQAVGMDPDEGAPYLLHMFGVKEGTERLELLSPEAIKARTFELLRQLWFRVSRSRPLILAIEDLHWIDGSSEDFLASLVDGLAGAAVLLLTTYRPGYRPPWIDKSYSTQVALRPLSPGESLTVVQSVLHDAPLPEPLAQVILSKAEGNPFFLEELTRAVIEQEDLRPTVTVPDTIQGVLMARIDRLSDGARQLLQSASVLGREASRRALAAMADGPEALDPHLRELTRLEFLYEQTGAEEPVYVFKHALIQEVAYLSLLEPRRRQYHGAAGAALEAVYAGRTHEVVELLAHHFGLSGADEKAVDCAILAAEKAQRRWANTEALAHFDAALRRLQAMPDTEANRLRRIDAVIKQAEVKFALGQHAEHVEALERVRELVETTADPRRRAAWYYWTGFLQSLTGARPEVAIEYCREAVAIAAAEGFEEIRAFAESCLAQVYTVAGDFRGAVAAAERALVSFEARGNVWWVCRTLGIASSAANVLGEWEKSLEYCRRALEHGRAVSDLRLEAGGWWRTGSAHLHRGDLTAALRCCDEALALSRIPFDAAMARAMKGYALVRAGDAEAGAGLIEEAVAWFDRSGLTYIRARMALWQAEGYLRQRRLDVARALLERVLRDSLEHGYRYVEGVAHRLLGECLAPESPAAADHLASAARILEELGARNDLAKTLAAQADVRRATGDRAGARQLLERALALFDALRTADEPARVRSAIVALDQPAG